MKSKTFSKLVELSVFGLLGIVIFAWGQSLDWRLDTVGRLEIFPLLGLIAYVTMWWHYFVGFIKRRRPDYEEFKNLHQVSGYWVFVAFTLHPALLVSWGLANGYELPPDQLYEDYIEPGNYQFITIGILSLVAFVAYDLARWLGTRKFIKKAWPFIDAASDVAFIAIWLHALMLGQRAGSGWFMILWWVLGVTSWGFISHKRFHLHVKRSA